MGEATDSLRGYPIVVVEATHQLRVVSGVQEGVIFPLGYERVRVGRPYEYRPDEFSLGDAAGLIGRNVYVVWDKTCGHRVESLGPAIPLVRERPVGPEGTALIEGDTILLGDVVLVYERLPPVPSMAVAYPPVVDPKTGLAD